MRMRRLQIALVSILGIAFLAAVGIAVYQSRRLAQMRQQRDTARQSLRESRDALQQSELKIASLLNAPKPVNNDKAVIARRNATIQKLNGELTAAQASIAELQDKLSAAVEENKKALANANGNSERIRADLQAQLNALQKKLSSAQADIKNSSRRMAELQKANSRLKDERTKSSARLAQREHLLDSLQDLDRRRQTYLKSIADRCRNITNQFRTMSGMLGSSHGQDSGAFSGGALDLIQNAITLSDNDLQHLNDLDARAFRLQKKLEKM